MSPQVTGDVNGTLPALSLCHQPARGTGSARVFDASPVGRKLAGQACVARV